MSLVLLGLVTLLLAACGGSSDSSGPDRAPILSNLRLTQVTAPSGGTVQLQVDVFDFDGDVFGGQCIITTTNFGSTGGQIGTLQPGATPNMQRSTVFCTAPYRGRGVSVIGTIQVIDLAGHPSNQLGFTFVSEERGRE